MAFDQREGSFSQRTKVKRSNVRNVAIWSVLIIVQAYDPPTEYRTGANYIIMSTSTHEQIRCHLDAPTYR